LSVSLRFKCTRTFCNLNPVTRFNGPARGVRAIGAGWYFEHNLQSNLFEGPARGEALRADRLPQDLQSGKETRLGRLKHSRSHSQQSQGKRHQSEDATDEEVKLPQEPSQQGPIQQSGAVQGPVGPRKGPSVQAANLPSCPEQANAVPSRRRSRV
jgi:hypothetical protein